MLQEELIQVTLRPRAITQTQLVFIVIVLNSVGFGVHGVVSKFVRVVIVICFRSIFQRRRLEVRHFLKLYRVGSVLCPSGNVSNAAANSRFILL